MKELSILIPARNEEFLARTIQDILENKEADTEVIVGLDGEWADPPVPQHPDVNIIYYPESIGQRAITNRCASLSRAKYLMKLDAHCSFDKGFDRKMIEAFKEVGDDVTMVPVMRNLWVYSWNCRDCNWKEYQGPTPEKCERCGGNNLRKKMMWVPKANVRSTAYCFNSKPTFCYFGEYKHRPEYLKDKAEKGLTETMSLQGSCFVCSREKYHELNLCDETLGSWGHQGIEVACKTWLSGGRVLVNHKTWYAHMFRTRPGFSFPWPVSGREQYKTKKNVENLLFKGNWEKQTHPVSWLVKKFWPVSGWTEEDLKVLEENEKRT